MIPAGPAPTIIASHCCVLQSAATATTRTANELKFFKYIMVNSMSIQIPVVSWTMANYMKFGGCGHLSLSQRKVAPSLYLQHNKVIPYSPPSGVNCSTEITNAVIRGSYDVRTSGGLGCLRHHGSINSWLYLGRPSRDETRDWSPYFSHSFSGRS